MEWLRSLSRFRRRSVLLAGSLSGISADSVCRSSFTERPYTTIAKPKNATYRMTSCVAREMIVSVPLASTTGTMVQKTPMGVKYMMVVMIFRHTSLMESIRFRNGVPFSPTAISVKPMIRQTPEPGACFRQQMRRLGWKGSGFSGCQGYCSFL